MLTLDKMPNCYLKSRLKSMKLEDCTREIDLAGMAKYITIPVVDISSSVAKCLESSIEKPNLKPDKDALSFIKLCTIKEFYKKHGIWPNLSGESKKVQAHKSESSWPGGADKFRLKDFETVKMDKMLEFDFKVDTSELLKDKSCCPVQMLNHELHSNIRPVRSM